MRRLMIPIIAVSLVAAPAVLHAQRGGQQRAALRAQAGPLAGDQIQRILEHRAELGLTAAQVTQIERVRTQLAAQNEPLLAKLQGVGPQGAGRGAMAQQGRAGMRDRVAARPDSMRNLTEEQRRELRAQMDTRRDSMQAQMGDRRDAMRARGDSLSAEERAKLRGQMQGRARAGGAMGGQAEELRPVMEEIRSNTEKAVQELQGILTAEQRTKLRSIRPAGPGGARQR